MKKVIFFGAGLGILGLAVWKYWQTQRDLLSKFKYRIVGIKFQTLSLSEVTLAIQIKFMSDSDIEAKVHQVYTDVYVDDNRVGYINNNSPFIIAAHGSSYINLTLSFNPALVLKNVVNIVFNNISNKDVRIKLDGWALVTSGFIRVKLPVNYETTLKDYLTENNQPKG